MPNHHPPIPLKWLKLSRFCELTGETEAAIQSRRTEGIWLDSIHVQKREGRLYVNIDAYNRWVEQGLSKSEHLQSQHIKARKARREKDQHATQENTNPAG